MSDEEYTETGISPKVVENHAKQLCYLVEYDEDRWKEFDREAQEQCFATWAKRAKPLKCQFVVLRLFPDALFPSGDKTVPYVARSYPIERETFNPVIVSHKLTAYIHPDTYNRALDGEQMQLKLLARQELAMRAVGYECSYEISTRDLAGVPLILERGRL